MKDLLLLILKFFLTVFMFPVLIASTRALYLGLAGFDAGIRHALWTGAAVYLLLKLFVHDLSAVYTWGQNMVTSLFQFLKPLVNAAPYILPIYTILSLLVYGVLMLAGKSGGLEPAFGFIFSFTFVMHIVLTAEALSKKDAVPGKPNYFFAMTLVYILDVFLLAMLLSLVMPGFSFVHFFKSLTSGSFGIYKAVFIQLF
jgi:hypothetical protein